MKRAGFAFIELLICLLVLLLAGSAVATLGYHFLVSPLGWRGWLFGSCTLPGMFVAFWVARWIQTGGR